MVTANGKSVVFNGIRYEFSNPEDAKGFADCINGNGSPTQCAATWRCKVKLTAERKSPGLSR